jgi:phytoene desaturase
MPRRVVVIGAGFAGLSAAAYLAKAGHHVTVLEATDQPGGRARVEQRDGYTFDLGPSWYLMPDVFDEFFAHFGHTSADFYKLIDLEPSYRVFDAQHHLDIGRREAAIQLFEQIETGAGEGLRRLLDRTKSEYRTVRSGLLELDGLSPLQALRPDVLRYLLNPDLARSYHSRIQRYIKRPELQHILEFMTVFMGGSPYNVPAYYSLLAHVDMGLGVRYPQGGFGRVARAFEQVAREVGAQIHYREAVTAITLSGRRATGVDTALGHYDCDVVVATGDYPAMETQLLPAASQSYRPSYWRRRHLSPSALLITAGVKRRLPGLLHHNLLFDTDWDRHFREVFDEHRWSDQPLVYVCAPSRTDPTVAPPGRENLFMLAPMTSGLQPTAAELDRTAHAIIARVERAAGQAFASDIESLQVYGPDYFTRTFGAYQGNAFGLAHTLRQSAVWRPRLRSRRVPNLYFAGQYTNPGTGVPMVVLSGRLAARLVERDQ